jgi:hypothetical protein
MIADCKLNDEDRLRFVVNLISMARISLDLILGIDVMYFDEWKSDSQEWALTNGYFN